MIILIKLLLSGQLWGVGTTYARGLSVSCTNSRTRAAQWLSHRRPFRYVLDGA